MTPTISIICTVMKKEAISYARHRFVTSAIHEDDPTTHSGCF